MSNLEKGAPVAGSLSEKRGKRAHGQISYEILQLVEIIENKNSKINFGELFEIYTRISNKLVGILLRARKYKILDFDGETLFQRKDDHVEITLLKSAEEIREMMYHNQQDFTWGKCLKN